MAVPAIRGSLYINGKWCEADSGRRIAVTNPATEEKFCEVGYGGRAETDRAIEAAAKAFGSWRAATAYERAKPLRKTADLIRERVEEIARALTTALPALSAGEAQKPVSEFTGLLCPCSGSPSG